MNPNQRPITLQTLQQQGYSAQQISQLLSQNPNFNKNMYQRTATMQQTRPFSPYTPQTFPARTLVNTPIQLTPSGPSQMMVMNPEASTSRQAANVVLVPPLSTEVFQNLLEINKQLIKILVEYQNNGWLEEPEFKIYQARLQNNLTYLATTADYVLKPDARKAGTIPQRPPDLTPVQIPEKLKSLPQRLPSAEKGAIGPFFLSNPPSAPKAPADAAIDEMNPPPMIMDLNPDGEILPENYQPVPPFALPSDLNSKAPNIMKNPEWAPEQVRRAAIRKRLKVENGIFPEEVDEEDEEEPTMTAQQQETPAKPENNDEEDEEEEADEDYIPGGEEDAEADSDDGPTSEIGPPEELTTDHSDMRNMPSLEFMSQQAQSKANTQLSTTGVVPSTPAKRVGTSILSEFDLSSPLNQANNPADFDLENFFS